MSCLDNFSLRSDVLWIVNLFLEFLLIVVFFTTKLRIWYVAFGLSIVIVFTWISAISSLILICSIWMAAIHRWSLSLRLRLSVSVGEVVSSDGDAAAVLIFRKINNYGGYFFKIWREKSFKKEENSFPWRFDHEKYL